MFESTKQFIRDEIKEQLKYIPSHSHHTFYPAIPEPPEIFPPRRNIDETISFLIKDSREKAKIIAQLQSDLTVIYTYYRDELCGDCCHADVCKRKDSIKFGDICEDRPLPCSLEIEIGETEEEQEEVNAKKEGAI